MPMHHDDSYNNIHTCVEGTTGTEVGDVTDGPVEGCATGATVACSDGREVGDDTGSAVLGGTVVDGGRTGDVTVGGDVPG